MIRFFIDASVLFSAAYSARGYSRDLLTLAAAEQPQVVLVISDDVKYETRRNLAYNVPDKITALARLYAVVPFEIVNPSRRSAVGAARYVALKDAPIVAAARKAKVDGLVTFDEKHLLRNVKLASYIRAPVIRPQQAVEMVNRGGQGHRHASNASFNCPMNRSATAPSSTRWSKVRVR